MHQNSLLAVCLAIVASLVAGPVKADDVRDELNVRLRDVLHDGEWAINRGRLQDAERRLIDGDASLARQDPAYGAWRSRTLLARVYLESEQFDKARAVADDAVKQLAALAQRDEQQLRRDRQTIALLLADIEAAWKDREAALGRAAESRQHAEAEAKLVGACLAIPNGLRWVDPAWELHVLRRLAELEQSLGRPREATDAWRQLVRLATDVRDRFAPRVAPGPDYVPAEPYLAAVRSLAAAYQAQNRLADAVACFAPLLPLPLEDAVRVRVLSDIAGLHRQSLDYAHEREFLAQAVAVETRAKAPAAARLAQLHVQIATAWDDEVSSAKAQQPQQAPPSPADADWTLAAKFFEQARREAQGDKDDPQRALADEMLYLQQLQSIYQHQERYDEAEVVARELHNLRVDRLLPSDPRIYRSKSSWGSYLVKRRQYREAVKQLDEAVNYWSTRNPPEPNVQVRTWIARAEIHRVDGEIKAASDLLDRAEALCALHEGRLVADQVRMSLCVNRGLVLAEQGMYQRAVESYTRALELGDKLGSAAGELRASALLNLAMVYKSQLQFRDARDFCGRAVEDRLRVLGPTDAEMLPYYIAVAGLDITERKVTSLEDSVKKAWDVCVAHGLDRKVDPDVATVWHQRAMIDYIKNEQSPDAQRRQAAREAFQQSLKLQEQLATPDMQARTLHYLAKLKYLDWNEALLNWKRRDAQNDPEYAVHFRQFDLHRADFEKSSQEYVRLVERYEGQMATYKQTMDNKTATPAEYDNLLRQRETLVQRRDELAAAHAQLAREEENCQQQYLAAKQQQRGDTLRRLDADLNEAEALARRSVDLLDGSGVFPNLHYAALCNHGQILWSLADWHRTDEARRKQFEDQAVGQLGRAVQLTETPRSMTTGGDIARAEFFSNYATAFDLLVDWHARRDQPDEALRYAEMGRNRTFLDQIRASEVDVRDTLSEESKPLLDEEHELLKRHGEKLARARALARKPAAERAPDEQRELDAVKTELEVLRQRYVLVRDRIYAASPQYSGLARADVKHDDVLAALAEVSSPKHPLLYYYVGAANSHLFLVAGDVRHIDHYALEIPEGPGADVLAQSRRVPAAVLTELVNRYREVISDEEKSKTLLRGGFKSADALVVTGRAKMSYAALTDLLLPPPARDKIQSLAPDYVTIVPDGPLHHLPFEALPLSDKADSKFVLDEFPALAMPPA